MIVISVDMKLMCG